MRQVLILFLALVSACSVTVKSSQFSAIKGLFDSTREETLGRLWRVHYHGESYEAYPLSKGELVRFYTLGQVEVDLEAFFVTRIESFAVPKRQVLISTEGNSGKLIQGGREKIYVQCDAVIQERELEYSRKCYNSNLSWVFRNEFRVNDARELVYIKAYYSPFETPIVMWSIADNES